MTSVSELFDFDEFPEINLPDDGLIVITRVRNEMLRLPYFLEHHRSIGAKHFFIIDNDSTDQSSDFLIGQPDVTHLPTSKPYKNFKSEWLWSVLNHYCMNRWVLLLDADEQFVYPGWPDTSIESLLKYWQAKDVEGVLAPMIDMYSSKPLKHVNYLESTPFLDTCPYFDTTSTWVLFYDPNEFSPNYDLRGGPRGRLFGVQPKKSVGPAFQRPLEAVRHYCLKPSRAWGPLSFQNKAQRKLHGYLPKEAPCLNKVPLLRWTGKHTEKHGTHRVDAKIKLADDWCALLHFKFFQDFIGHVKEEIIRGARHNKGIEYKNYYKNIRRILDCSMIYSGSRKFQGISDIYNSGLVHCSDDLQYYIGTSFQTSQRKEELA
ncbi:glycosyltransferase family 2 protein [Pseudovibrio sp. Tun.PSC04-5.I4]|uniref:glycosyltransferase family 2 protein n=1 Tax=Pseudovibrio sp. Tun.PSC04-5.I4 TaxID=1798213 RepID=UPI0008832EC8|nr:glycosyltransferase family 2 protein [Pseudovibrio sp. Tun.PSC04-5.I4]SDR18688.1 Glycosyl transferase family 2 [Pseudovibrio sp. Tun.PSC04-5.I4]